MRKKSARFIALVMVLTFVLSPMQASAATSVLKKGMRSTAVASLQKDLKTLGFMTVNPTAYYGDITASAVKKLQTRYGITKDGIAGPETMGLINKLLGRSGTASQTKAGTVAKKETDKSDDYLIPWFGQAEKIFARGDTAKVYDIKTGLSFNIKRTYGYNHADCEPLIKADTQIMKKIYGGQWSWARRAIIVTVDGKKIAASMAGMPHAGVDSEPANKYVKSRSGGYGAGDNLDTVKGNGMDGHFDIHFLGSKTHDTNKVNAEHQNMVKAAAAWAAKNY